MRFGTVRGMFEMHKTDRVAKHYKHIAFSKCVTHKQVERCRTPHLILCIILSYIKHILSPSHNMTLTYG